MEAGEYAGTKEIRRPDTNKRAGRRGVSDGIRTRDRLDHNQELYQLSYAHLAKVSVRPGFPARPYHARLSTWLS